MSREEDLAPELKSLEAALASLVPRADRLGRDRLMYRAGQESVRAASGQSSSRLRQAAWPAAFAAMTAAAAVLAVMLAVRPGPEVVERIVYLPAGQPAENAAGERDAERAPDAPVPEPPSAGSRPATAGGSAWALAKPASAWLALRRPVLDLETLDQILEPEQPGTSPEPVRDPGRERAGATSYRQLLRDLLADGATGRL